MTHHPNNPSNPINPRKLSLLVGVAGAAIALSPMPSGYKIVSTVTASLVCFGAAIEEVKEKEARESRLTKSETELNLARLLLENDRASLEADLEAIAQLKHQLEMDRSENEHRLHLLEESTLASLAIREAETNREIEAATTKAARRLWVAKSKAWKSWRKRVEKMQDRLASEIEWASGVAIAAKSKADSKLQARIGKVEELLTLSYQEWQEAGEQLLQSGQQQLIELRAADEAALSSDLGEGQRALSQAIANIRKETAEAALKHHRSLSAPMNLALQQAVSGWLAANEQIAQLEGRLEAIAKPRLCPYSNRAGEKANEFIRFMAESANLKLCWMSSLFLAGDCLQVDFTVHESEDQVKAISRLQKPQVIEALCIRFGTEGIILTQNHIDHCWRATIPANEGYKGSVDPVAVVNETSEMQSLAQIEQKMKGFIAIAQPVPSTKEFSRSEKDLVAYLMFWRQEMEGKPNITSIPGLLEAVYRDKPSGTAMIAGLGESLGDRLARLQVELRSEYSELFLESV